MLRKLLLLVIFLSLFVSLFFATDSSWTTYTDKLGYFSLSYPTRYSVSQSYNPVVFVDPASQAQMELFYTTTTLSPYDYLRTLNPQATVSSVPTQVGNVPAVVETGQYQDTTYTSYVFRHPNYDILYVLTLDSRLALSRRTLSTLLSSFTFSTPQPSAPSPVPSSPTPITSTGCKVSGCSGELCLDASAPDQASICVYKDEYACYKTATCEKQPTGRCAWTQTPELASCLSRY